MFKFLDRLLTGKEQLLLLLLAGSVFLAAVGLYVHSRLDSGNGAEQTGIEHRHIEELTGDRGRQPRSVRETWLQGKPDGMKRQDTVVVSVTGAVNEPGVYELPSNTRVNDALEKAGGPRDDADMTDINLAAKLIDGTTLVIPARTRPGDVFDPDRPRTIPQYTISGWVARPSPAHAGGPAGDAPPLVDLNNATREELESLPGIGPVLAGRIMAHRTQKPFGSVDELAGVPGIGDKTLATLRPLVTVRGGL